ncbi:hypothetical protein JOC76_002947 [Neobacillus cucumis]|nr:hypothetical protein [Neobacillus cucumis]
MYQSCLTIGFEHLIVTGEVQRQLDEWVKTKNENLGDG